MQFTSLNLYFLGQCAGDCAYNAGYQRVVDVLLEAASRTDIQWKSSKEGDFAQDNQKLARLIMHIKLIDSMKIYSHIFACCCCCCCCCCSHVHPMAMTLNCHLTPKTCRYLSRPVTYMDGSLLDSDNKEVSG